MRAPASSGFAGPSKYQDGTEKWAPRMRAAAGVRGCVSFPEIRTIQKYSSIIGSLNILSTSPRFTAGLLWRRRPTRICG